MMPTEQIKKRMHDLTTENLTERLFFENKFREFKEYLEGKGLSDYRIARKINTDPPSVTRSRRNAQKKLKVAQKNH